MTLHHLTDRDRLRAAENELAIARQLLAVERERVQRTRLALLREEQAHRETQRRLRRAEVAVEQLKAVGAEQLERLR